MAWLLGLVVLTALVYLAITAPEMRKGILVFIGVFIVAVAALLYYEYSNEQEASLAIGPDEIELRDFETYKLRGVFYTRGSIKNLSETNSTDTVEIRIRAHNCADPAQTDNCEIIGESLEKVRLEIPKGQVRAIERSVAITSLPAVDTLSWTYDVVSVRAVVN